MGLRVIVLIRENLKVEQLAGVIKLRRKAGNPLSSIILRPRVLVRLESNSRLLGGFPKVLYTVLLLSNYPTFQTCENEELWINNPTYKLLMHPTHNSSPHAHAIHEGISEEESLRRRHLEISVTPTSAGKSEIDLLNWTSKADGSW